VKKRTTSKVFTLRRTPHQGLGECNPAAHRVIAGGAILGINLPPAQFTRVTGLTIPVGGRIRVKLVVVKRRKG